LKAFNASGASSASNTDWTVTAGASGVPAAPGALAATAVSNTGINLTWTNNSATATAVLVENSTNNAAFTQVASLAGSATSYSGTGLTAGTLYYYRVRAQNAAGTSAYSNTASATTTGGSVPAAPGALAATAVSNTGINLTWTNNSATATAVLVENSTNNTTFTQVASLAGSATSYSSTGLTAGTLYYYRVRAQNAAGTSAYSNTASASTTGGSLPAAPSAVAVGQSSAAPTSQLNVYWKDNSNNETGFQIFRSLDNVTFTQIATVGPNVVEYDNTGLAINTSYYYYVRAYNAAGASAASNTDWSCTVSGGC
jgi:titin